VQDWQGIYKQKKANKARVGIFLNKCHKNWTNTIYLAMLVFFMCTWRDRNEALHGKDLADSEEITRAQLTRRVDWIYSTTPFNK
jgi:hypothetical protein